MDPKTEFELIAKHLTRSRNPVSKYAVNAAIENADDSHGVDTIIAPYNFENVQIVDAKAKNQAYWEIALSTLAMWADDSSMWAGYPYSRRQINGFRTAYLNARFKYGKGFHH